MRFGYSAADGSATRRVVEPHRLVAAGRRWYLVGYDLDRSDWRIFRVDRVAAAPQLTGARFAPRPLPVADPAAPDAAAAYVTDKLSGLQRGYRAVATLQAPASYVSARLRDPASEITPLGPDRCRLVTRADSLEWLAFRLGALGCEFELHEPDELAAYLAELAGRLQRGAGLPPRGASPGAGVRRRA
jgi:predicted DNA-binding transcriptional regulator YafY